MRVLLLLLLGACAAGSEASTSTSASTEPGEPAPVASANVTVLAPLEAGMLGADTVVGAGKLLPDAVRAEIGQLVEHATADASMAALRVVCTRVVPCEKAIASESACAAQVRFVLQPVDAIAGAADAAVHVFYELPDAARPVLARRLAAGPIDAPAAAALGHVARVTFLRNVDVKGNAWVFGGFDAARDGRPDGFVPLAIPRVQASEQRVVANGDFPFAESLSPKPPVDASPQLGLLLDPVRLGILFDADAEVARARVLAGDDAARALEDPRKHDTLDTDCASCHVAGAARNVAAASAAAHGFALPPSADLAGAKATGRTPAEALRACGYVGTTPVLSQRAVNETAIAAAKWGEIARMDP